MPPRCGIHGIAPFGHPHSLAYRTKLPSQSARFPQSPDRDVAGRCLGFRSASLRDVPHPPGPGSFPPVCVMRRIPG